MRVKTTIKGIEELVFGALFPLFGKGVLFFSLFFLSFSVNAQLGKEANFWYFGTNAGIDFNSGVPVAVTNGAIFPSEGCSSISDANGNLLFYTDGRTIYNRNHVIMGNGAGLSGGSAGSATQAALIVKKPGSTSEYFVFTLDEQAQANGLCYSVVDMNLNATLGGVTAVKNVQVYTPSTEKMTAVKHCNGRDVWLITHEKDNNTFRTFLITNAGVGPAVISSVGTSLNVGAAYAGQMKVSPTGAKLALTAYTNSNVLEVFDFNNITGAITNPITIGNNPWGYGVEFSPNGRYLYVTESNLVSKKIYQFDVCAGSSAAFLASKVHVGTSASIPMSMQLGPDKKIYVARANNSNGWLGVINSPNSAGLACNYVDNGVALSGRLSQQGLPGFVQSFFRDTFPDFLYASNCLTITFSPPPTNCGNPINTVSWNFGEPSSGAANTSTQLNPSHTYTLPGNYTVRLIVNCNDTIIQTIPVVACPLTVTSNNSTVCPGICTSVSANVSAGAPGYTYTWSPNIGAGPGPHNVCPTATTVYTITVTDLAGVTATSTSTVTVSPATTPNINKVDVTCNGSANGTVSVAPSGGTPAYTYSWSNGTTGVPAISNLAPGTYSVTIRDANGCSVVSSANITQPLVLAAPIVSTNVKCNGGNDGTASTNPAGGTAGYVYSWSGGQTTQSVTGLSAGNYTVTVTDSKGCKQNSVVNISQPAAPVTATLTVLNHVSCYNGSNGVVSASAGGGTPTYNYSWNTGSTNATVSNLIAGSYSVTITDAQGCTIAGSLNVTQPTAAVTGTVNVVSNVSCLNGNNGSAAVIGGGGTPAYTYSWSNGFTGANATGLVAGTYTATVTDNKGCTFTANVNITQPATAVTATVNVVSNVLCNGGNNGSLTVNAGGGTGGYSYSWSSAGVTTQTISNLTVGNYSVTVTDANGCTATASSAITQPLVLGVNTNVIQHVKCFGGSDGAVAALANGGTASYTYSWSQSSTGTNVSNLSAGNYTVTVTDANGCTAAASVAVNQPLAALSNTVAVVNNVSCFGGSNGSANTTPGGGTLPYNYVWSNSQVVSTATGLSMGIYSVTITDANGCTLIDNVNIAQPATALTATASVTASVTCNGGNNGSLTVLANGGTGSYTYLWTPSAQTSQNATGLASGSYSVTVTDANGCTFTDNISITQPAVSVTSTVTVTANVLCNGGADGTANVSASGGAGSYTYSWSNGQTTTSATGLSALTYSVVVSDANGCTSLGTATVTQPLALAANAPVGNHVSCFGGNNGSASVLANGGSGAYTYSWTTTETTTSITGLTAGTYSVTVTDNNGCTTNASVTITEPLAAVTATVSVVNNVSCYAGNNGSLTVNANGGTLPYTYSWIPGTQSMQNATSLIAGTYTAVVTDANGCTAFHSNIITQPATALTATASVVANVLCNGGNTGSATVNAGGGTGAYTYSWNNGQSLQTATALAAGTYTATVTDANGCTASDFITITQPPTAVSLTVTVNNNVSCNGGNDGSVSISASGGNPGYSYVWWGGQTDLSITGLAAGIYNATVTDASGCTAVGNANITEPPVLTATVNVIQHVSCFGGSDGAAIVNGNGGTIPYNYTWSTTGATQSVSNLAAGVYTATITDALGCVATASTTITEPLSPLTGTVSVVNHVSCFAGSNGSASVNAGGGTPVYNYSWSNGQLTNPSTGLAAGNYTVTITDAKGCTYSDNIDITEPATPVTLTLTAVSDVSCHGGTDGVAEVEASGGTGAYTYSWSTTETNTTISSLAAGIYTATVTDANGCTVSGNVNITEPTPIVINLSPSLTICDGANTALTAAAVGGSPGYNYLWSTTETTTGINVSPAATSTYSVLVTDANLCTSVQTVTVTVSDPLQVAAISVPGAICAGQSAMLSANLSGGHGVNNYIWQPGAINTSTVNVNPAGTTTYTVSASNDCGVVTTTLEVTVNPLPVVSFTADDPDGCPQHCVTFSNTTANSSSAVWYFGDGGSSVVIPDAVHCYTLSGQYSVTLTVTDINGCSNTLEENNYITVYPEPEAKFVASPQETSILAPIVKFTNQSIDADAWSWAFGDPLNSTSAVEHPEFNYPLPGTYTVQLAVTNTYGCTPDTAWLEIIVKEDYALYVPNAFTPDGDGLNDVFMPLGMGLEIATFEMYIYDRWGNLIYETKDINKGWDGRANGGTDIAQQDTYVWKMRVFDFQGNIHSIIGHINLVR